MIESGAIGDVITARAAFIYEFDEYWFKERKPWRYETSRAGGGIAFDGGSHWIRPLRMWLGEIEEVIAILGHPLEQMEGESLVRSLLRFQSGVTASFDAMMIDTVFAPDPWWRITGSKGEITIDSGFFGGIRLHDESNREGELLMEPKGYPQSFGPELADFASAVLNGTEPKAGPEQSLGELRTALSIYRSAQTKEWEKVWD